MSSSVDGTFICMTPHNPAVVPTLQASLFFEERYPGPTPMEGTFLQAADDNAAKGLSMKERYECLG
jgi:hypothetical protein